MFDDPQEKWYKGRKRNPSHIRARSRSRILGREKQALVSSSGWGSNEFRPMLQALFTWMFKQCQLSRLLTTVRRTLTPVAPDITLIVLEHPSREPQGPLGQQKSDRRGRRRNHGKSTSPLSTKPVTIGFSSHFSQGKEIDVKG